MLRRALPAAVALVATLFVLSGPAAAQASSAGAPDLGPTLNKIAASGTVYLAHREAAVPFSYVQIDEDGEFVHGYTWALCTRIVKALGERLGQNLRIEPVTVSANTRTLMIRTGMADINCGAATNNVARQKQVAFSNTFYVAEAKILVRKDSGIRSLADLANKTVVTTVGATADRLIKTAALANGVTLNYLIGRNHDESMALLASGQAQAYVADDAILMGQRAKESDASQFVLLDAVLSVEPYGLILPRDDPQFKKAVDEALVAIMKSGELEWLYNKWFLGPIPPKRVVIDLPMSDRLKEAIANPNDRPAY